MNDLALLAISTPRSRVFSSHLSSAKVQKQIIAEFENCVLELHDMVANQKSAFLLISAEEAKNQIQKLASEVLAEARQ